jgi:iron complex outermembrane receptor protein
MCAAVLLAPLANPAAHAQEESATELQTVVISARKRDEALQDVPVSIKAYTADDLAAQSIQSLFDLGQVTPNLLYGQKVQSGSSAGQIYIRGIGQQDTNVTFNPGVGVYVDGVYLGRAQANDLDMADVKRVEVLYGPQGTLFGKNTNGGAINIVTDGPDFAGTRPAGDVEIRAGDYGRLDALGMVKLPLSTGTAALELSAARYGQDGYSVRTDGQQQADQNRWAGRIQLGLRPSGGLEAILRIDGTTFDEHSAAYRLVDVRETSTIPVLYATQTPYRYDDRWVTASDFSYNGTGPNRNAGGVWGTSLTLTWSRPWGTLKSITAWRKLCVDSQFDPDGSPLTVLDVFNIVQQHQVSQEFQATGQSADSKLDWVAGLYYFREAALDKQPVNIAREIFGDSANFDPESQVVNHNVAIYGQADVVLADKLKLNLGIRAGVDMVDIARTQYGYPIPIVEQPTVHRSASWNSLLPRLGLQYQWTPEVMAYVSAAEGSKSGGFNGRASSIAEFNRYDPERVWSYEIGLRSDWLGKRLRFNATAFYSDYRDYQIQQNRSVTDPATGQPVAFSFVGNMPKAAIQGGEFALEALPMANLRLGAGLGITDGRYITVIPGAPVTTGDEFVNAPKFTLTVSAEYAAALGDRGQLVGHVDFIHKSEIQYDYGNSPLVAQPPYGLLNARLSWDRVDHRLSVYLFGTNLTDTHYAVGGIDDGPTGSLGEVVKLMGPPREWGVGARYRL